MPPWTIVLASIAAGVAAAAALAFPEVAATPRSEIGVMLLPKLPAIAVAALGVYGLAALSLTTTSLIARVLWVQRNMASAASGRAIRRRDWIDMIAADGSRQTSATVSGGPEAADGNDTVPAALTPNEARSEIARRHYVALARTHFFSVLIVLVGIVGLGAARDFGSLPFRTGAIPTVSAILVVVGLLLLAILGRIAIDVAAEPLVEGIASSPAEPLEIDLLRRIVALQEASRAGKSGNEGTTTGLPDRLPEQLAAAIGQGCRPLLEAVAGIVEKSRALEETVRSSIEAIASQQARVDDNVPVLALPELQAAVEELTAVLRRLSATPEYSEEPPFSAGTVPSRRTAPAPGIARELRRLLQEIDTAR